MMLPSGFNLTLIFLLGLVLGSFLNTIIHRLPRGASVCFPPSYCPDCRQRLSPLDLVPLGGFLFLGGKCRFCREPIPWRYPLVELLTGGLAAVLYYRFGFPVFFPTLVMVSLVLVAAFTDMEEGVVPDRLTLPALVGGLLASYWSPLTTPGGSILGVLAGGGILLLIALLSHGGMGGGDIKLMAALGAWLGWEKTLFVLFLALLLGGIGGICFLLLKIKNRRDTMAFAPFIAGALVLTLLADDLITRWYFLLVWQVAGL